MINRREAIVAIEAIARRALEKGTGARGLRGILERVLLETMFEVPAKKDIVEVVIEPETINDNAPPRLVYKEAERTAS